MPADPCTEPLPAWVYRSEAFAEDLIDDEADRRRAAAPSRWRLTAPAARPGNPGWARWLPRLSRLPRGPELAV